MPRGPEVYWERISETALQLVDDERYYGLVDRLDSGWAAARWDELESFGWPTEAEARAWLLGTLGIKRSGLVWDER